MVLLKEVRLLYGEFSGAIHFQRADMILYLNLYRKNQEDK